MNAEEGKAGGRRAPGAEEPILIALREAMTAGYQGLSYVGEGVLESVRLRRQAGAGTADPAAAQRAAERVQAAAAAGGEAGPRRGEPLELDDLVGLFTELLATAGRVAQEVAQLLEERAGGGRPPQETAAPLLIKASSGSPGSVQFRFRNTGATALKNVRLIATDLIGQEGPIPSHAITFEPHDIPHLRPGGTLMVKVSVDVPRGLAPDAYRGLIQSEPGDGWAVLQVDVVPVEAPPPARKVPAPAYARAGARRARA